MAFWIRNTTGGTLSINDLRKLTLPAGGERDLCGPFYPTDIKLSTDLDAALAAGNLTRIDGPAGAPIPYANAYDDLATIHAIDGASHTGSLTPADVGLGNVTNDAQLKRSAGDFATFAAKAAPVAADIILIEDSAAAGSKKSVQIGNIPTSGPAGGLKSGTVLAAAFAGNPKTASVNFGTAYADANYAVTLTSVTSTHVQFAPSAESKAAAGFTINTGANNINGLVEINWITAPYGEA